VSRGSAIADYDDDGDGDILVANLDDRPSLLRNEMGNRLNWIGLHLVGRTANRDAVGARARLVTADRVQVREAIRGSSFLSSEDPRLHFGLGAAVRIDSLSVHWPGGEVEVLTDLAPNRYHRIEQASDGGVESAEELTVSRIADHLYLIAGGGGNSVASVGDDGVLLVDSKPARMTPHLRRALASLGGGRVAAVINTHFHHDHVGGNATFAEGARLISHTAVPRRLRSGPGFSQRFFPELPLAGHPVETFDDTISLVFNGETVRAVHVPRSHTDGDVAVYFTGSDVVALGDLFFHGMFPFVDLDYGGDVETLIRHVDELYGRLGPEVRIVPGHGPLATREDLGVYLEMLRQTEAVVRHGIDTGRTLAQIKGDGLPERWRRWSWDFVPTRRWIEVVYWSLVAAERRSP
jgi:glyoxylase-like metal-dependent hydrolase (beta-lactamase superfamily II)